MDLDLLTLDRLRPHGVFTLTDTRALHRDRREVSKWEREGAIVRLAPATYIVARRWHEATATRRYALRSYAQCLRLRTPLALSHESAAALHGLPLMSMRSPITMRHIHLTRQAPGSSRSTLGYTLHRCYGPDQCGSSVDGMPVVRPVLAAFGVAQNSGFVSGVVAMDAALHLGLTTIDEGRRWLARIPRRPGNSLLRRTLEAADGLSESPVQTQVRLMLSALGHRMQPQVRLRTPDGAFVARVEGLIEELGVVVDTRGAQESVGSASSRSAHAIRSERRRQRAISDLGYAIVHLDHASLRDPRHVDLRVRDAARASQTPGRRR